MAEFQRAAWGAVPPKRPSDPLRNVKYGVVHHIGGGPAYPSDVASTLHQIQAMELHGDYVDISYCTGVDQGGNEWHLRGDAKDGATLGYAGSSYSVLAICNASASGFVATDQMLRGIAAAFVRAQQRGVLAHDAYVDGHHWFDAHMTRSPTACPGVLLGEIPKIRAYMTPAPVPKPSEVEPMLFPSASQKVAGKFTGAVVDCAKQTITARGFAQITPDPADPKGIRSNPNPWIGAYATAHGFVVVTSDADKYEYTLG